MDICQDRPKERGDQVLYLPLALVDRVTFGAYRASALPDC
jgi:hypothetical protein